jgi:phosphate/sulfate permease
VTRRAAIPTLPADLHSVRNLAMAWVLTLPASIVLAATLFWLFQKI